MDTGAKEYEDVRVREGDLVYYQYQDKKEWLGPLKVFVATGNDLSIFANGSMRKVLRCDVQTCEAAICESEIGEKEEEQKGVEEKQKQNFVGFEEQSFGDNFNQENLGKIDIGVMWSMTDVEKKRVRKG